MPTLPEVTDAHSKRITELHRRREASLRDALILRDTELRALPTTAALYDKMDDALAAALNERAATEREAADAREAALSVAVDVRSGGLRAAQAKRKSADLEALEQKIAAEAAAEQKFRDALTALGPTAPLETRQKVTQEADRVRKRELEEARAAHTKALTAAQNTFRQTVDSAGVQERTAGRTAEQAFAATMRVAESSHIATLATAERELTKGLQKIAEARDVLQRHQRAVSRIRSEAEQEERDLFTRFREELQTVKPSA